jgi:hypothetical protein
VAEDKELFLYDDFFVPADDPGIEIRPVIRGREVPMFVRRGFSFRDVGAARERASKRVLNRGTGQVDSVVVDETRAAIILLEHVIVSWPFVRRDRDGTLSPVPINQTTIGEFLGEGAEAVMVEIQRISDGRRAALVPFDAPSDKA